MTRTIDIEALCADKGLRITEQRKIIARVLGDSEDHPDVEAVQVAPVQEAFTETEKSHDFRVGGHGTEEGQWHGGPTSRFFSTYTDIVEHRRIVFTYDMWVDGKHMSTSLTTIALEPAGDGRRGQEESRRTVAPASSSVAPMTRKKTSLRPVRGSAGELVSWEATAWSPVAVGATVWAGSAGAGAWLCP